VVIKYSNFVKRLKLKEEINKKKMFGGWNHSLVRNEMKRESMKL